MDKENCSIPIQKSEHGRQSQAPAGLAGVANCEVEVGNAGLAGQGECGAGCAGTSAVLAISARQIGVCLGGVPVLHGVDVDIAASRWTAIVGPNGAGKSTLLRALAGLLPLVTGALHPDPAAAPVGDTGHIQDGYSPRGQVAASRDTVADYSRHMLNPQLLWWDTPLHTIPARQRARRMAWLGQGERAAPDLRVWDVVMLGRLPHQGWLATPSAHDVQAVEQALEMVHAQNWRQRVLGELSGGERQRVLLARALATQADLLLMDEPLMHLDPPHQADWLHVVQALVQQGRTVVSVLHEIPMALRADDLIMLRAGRIQHCGPTAHADSHRALEALFDQRIRIAALHSPDAPAVVAQQWGVWM